MLALKEDGTVWARGSNAYSQLGDGTYLDKAHFGQVPNLSDIIAVDAAERHCMALKKDGSVWVWGDNSYGQLGNGAADFVKPVKVAK